MTPAFRIIADHKDITVVIRDRLISLSVSDRAGLRTDTVEICLDDNNSKVELP